MTFYNPTDNEIHEEISKLAEKKYKQNPNNSGLDNWLQAEKEFWVYISQYQKLSEFFIEKHQDKVDWDYILQYQKLSEPFIEKYIKKVDWICISIHQKLSEPFIEKHQDKVNWTNISQYQKLSESFIEKHHNKFNWNYISSHQKLSESFIEKYQDKVNWISISIYQKLSEPFIEKHHDKFNWIRISIYQKLSESFIEKYKDKVNWDYISKYQKLSEEFRQKYNIEITENNWLYKNKEDKTKYIKENTNYEIINDEYILAYKSTRYNGYSVFNFQYQYEVGKTYESHCDCNLFNESSFGLSAWTKEGALKYYNKGELYLVKIMIDDIGAIVHKGNKIRCFKLEILEKVQ